MNGARTVRMTIGIHERRRINPSVGHWMWPLVKEFCLYWNHTKVYYQLFSIEKCALSVAKAPAAMQLSSPQRANKEHLSLTLFKVCWYTPWDGSLQSPEAPTEYLKFTHCFAEIEFEDVRGWYEKQDNVWGRHQKQDLLRVQWCRGSHRSACHFMLYDLRTEE